MSNVKTVEMIIFPHRKPDGTETLYTCDMTVNSITKEIEPAWVSLHGVCLGQVKAQVSYKSPDDMAHIASQLEALDLEIEKEGNSSKERIKSMLNKREQLKAQAGQLEKA